MNGSGHAHMSRSKMLRESLSRMVMQVDPLCVGMGSGRISGSANDGYTPCL